MPIGSQCESQLHIPLMEIVLKENHGIRKSNMTLENKMNYDAFVRHSGLINRTKTSRFKCYLLLAENHPANHIFLH